MTESADKRRRQRWRRAERIAAAKSAKAEEGRLLAQAAAEAEATKSTKAAQELKANNATRPARQDFEGAARRSHIW